MKVLLSAIACHPVHGSEGGVGWKAATTVAKKHHVHVLTSMWDREAVRQALATDKYPNLSFTFFGTDAPYHENRLIARLQSWQRYLDWTRQSLQIATTLIAREPFDVAHHVTYSSWRVPSPLWRLDLPFVWGPVGGAATYPLHLLGKLSTRSAIFEVARGLSNRQATQSSALRDCARNSSAVIASNEETFDKLLALRGESDGMHQLFPTFFTDQQIAMFRCDPADKPRADPIRLFSGGNIIGSKGLIFALEALKIAAQQDIKWRLTVGGYGPEVTFLKKKARALGIDQWIDFNMGFSGKDYVEKLKESHVFILPSFRENAGITMLEAMLAGCVPVIVDASAQGAVVDALSGFKIPISDSRGISINLAKVLEIIWRNPLQRIEMGKSASSLVQRSFREDAYAQKITAVYEEALAWYKTHDGRLAAMRSI